MTSSGQLFAQRLSGEVRRGQNWCAKETETCFSKKVCLSTWCGSQNSQTYPLVMYCWHKLSIGIAYLAIRWQSWQAWFKTKKLTNIAQTVGGWYKNMNISLWLMLGSCSNLHDTIFYTWYIYKYPWLQIFKKNIGAIILMSKYIDHGKAFLDTHRHFHPAIKILATISFVLAWFQRQKSNFQNICLDSQSMKYYSLPAL